MFFPLTQVVSQDPIAVRAVLSLLVGELDGLVLVIICLRWGRAWRTSKAITKAPAELDI